MDTNDAVSPNNLEINFGKATQSNQSNSIHEEHDLSKGEKAEATLAFQANLLSNVHDAVIAVDENFVLTYWNRMAEEMFGWTAMEAIGQSSNEMFQAKLDGLSHEEWLKKLLMDGRYRGEACYRRKDGVYLLTDFRSTVLRDSKGEFRGVVTSLRDITERKQMQEKLEEYAKNLERLVDERTEKMRKSEQSYCELYESIDEAFIATDWELNVIHWNKAAERVTTVATKDAMGKKLYEVLPEMDLVAIEPYLAALQARKPVRFMMNVISRQTSKPSIFEISTYPSTLGITIIVEDKTEEEQTKRLSTIGQVAGMVGHDLRNPLQTIVGEVYLARSELNLLPESEQKKNLQESVDSIAEQTSYMDKIVSDLQAFVKPVDLHKQAINLKQFIAGILAHIKTPQTVRKNVQVESDSLTADADPLLLKRVLINLVTNAVQAMPEGGELNVKAQSSDGQVTISVEDTGVGISEEIKPKLFTPLFTTKAMGQGFGLAVCRRVIEAHKGSITFESQVGRGTKFMVNLPQESK